MKYIHYLSLLVIALFFVTIGATDISAQTTASCVMPTSCQYYKTTSHAISSFPCWDGTDPIFSTPENISGLNHNTITIDDSGGLGGLDCGGSGSCTNTLILQSPDPSLQAKGLWWRMHDHEASVQYNLEVCRTALVGGNCTSWQLITQNLGVDTSGVGKEVCSDIHPEKGHPPGDQGCPDPIPDPKTCHQSADRGNWPCAMSFDEHIWASPSCSPQTITAVRLTFHNDAAHIHVADAVWILEGPSCTIQGSNPGATTLKNAAGTVLQTTTTSSYSFTNLPAGRTYTVESDGPTVSGSTLCLNSTTCHIPANSTNPAFQSGKTRQVINCPANGFVDLNFHVPTPTNTPTSTPTMTPTITPSPTPTSTITPSPTLVPPMCRQDVSLILPAAPTPTFTPSPTPTLPASPTPAAGLNLKIRVKFQGVLLANIANEAWKTQPVKVTLIKQIANTATNQGAQTIFTKSFENVQVRTTGEKDALGIAIWEGTFVADGVAAGENYSVLVKGSKHLQRKFCAQNPTDRAEEGFPYRCLGAGTIALGSDVTLDFASVLLQAGDLPGGTANGQDGIVNAYDVSLVLNMIRNGQSELANDLAIADMDLNGVVNAKDRSYLVETLEEKYGDEE